MGNDYGRAILPYSQREVPAPSTRVRPSETYQPDAGRRIEAPMPYWRQPSSEPEMARPTDTIDDKCSNGVVVIKDRWPQGQQPWRRGDD